MRRPTAAAAAQLFCLFFLFFKIFFRFSFFPSLCVLFQSPTHDLTSLVVCLSSALLFCFVFLPRESPNERTASITKHTAAVAVVVYIIKGQKLDMLLVSFLFLQAVIRSFIGWLYLVLVFFWGVSLSMAFLSPDLSVSSAQCMAWIQKESDLKSSSVDIQLTRPFASGRRAIVALAAFAYFIFVFFFFFPNRKKEKTESN